MITLREPSIHEWKTSIDPKRQAAFALTLCRSLSQFHAFRPPASENSLISGVAGHRPSLKESSLIGPLQRLLLDELGYVIKIVRFGYRIVMGAVRHGLPNFRSCPTDGVKVDHVGWSIDIN